MKNYLLKANFRNKVFGVVYFGKTWDTSSKMMNLFKKVLSVEKFLTFLGRIYIFNVNNGNDRIMSEICSKLTIETPGRMTRSSVFIDNFEQISHIVMLFPLLTYEKIAAGFFQESLQNKGKYFFS